ncbi:hypothetical protein [Chondromyces crocatus]|uniref:Uncharacterized protein n=1 Tax=Chondromyces crocatus TaxID=52 RepID=A0A0K1ECV5_CHOCO|nr:hypothetical protein [Chondromyces crocatus]AKT38408.1 uncharacterized protein CMC5_025540 [Chondromyces crocatus]
MSLWFGAAGVIAVVLAAFIYRSAKGRRKEDGRPPDDRYPLW